MSLSPEQAKEISDIEDIWKGNPSKSFEKEHNQTKYRSRYELEDSDDIQDPIVSSTALMGENVLDSPIESKRRTTTTPPVFRDLSDLGTPPRTRGYTTTTTGGSGSGATSLATNPPLTSENTNELSVGIMAQGLAWARRQRDRRQRQYLQYQAEQQLRKIRKAQEEGKSGNTTTNLHNKNDQSLLSNSTFRNIMQIAWRKSDAAKKKTDSETNLQDNDDDDHHHHHNDDNHGEIDVSNFVSKSGDGYSIDIPVDPDLLDDEDESWIPTVRVDDEGADQIETCPFILSPDEMQQIAVYVLPRNIAYCRWKRYYSLARDGDSFEACLRSIENEKQTLLVVRTSRNAVFGGFADMAWEAHLHGGACFYGGPTACLFRIDPVMVPPNSPTRNYDDENKIDGGGNVHCCKVSPTKACRVSKVKSYKWTGINRYVQLCDINNKKLAFGGGGEDGAFGLCVEQDFQVGTTGSCSTFNNEPLCDQEKFDIVDMEIYGFLLGQF
jgi:hypothetical protein